MTLAQRLQEEASSRKIRLPQTHLEHIYETVRSSQPKRYRDWLERHEQMASNREYLLPEVSEFYHRVDITQDEHDALQVTRRVIKAITENTVSGSQGDVAQWSAVMGVLDRHPEFPGTPGYDSLQVCVAYMGQSAYNISEGPSFIRTPLVLPLLEHKLYVEDLISH